MNTDLKKTKNDSGKDFLWRKGIVQYQNQAIAQQNMKQISNRNEKNSNTRK